VELSPKPATIWWRSIFWVSYLSDWCRVVLQHLSLDVIDDVFLFRRLVANAVRRVRCRECWLAWRARGWTKQRAGYDHIFHPHPVQHDLNLILQVVQLLYAKGVLGRHTPLDPLVNLVSIFGQCI